jgi:hypothetical protein
VALLGSCRRPRGGSGLKGMLEETARRDTTAAPDPGSTCGSGSKKPAQVSGWERRLGAPGRNRTCDTRFRKPLLYPLSYEGEGCRNGVENPLAECTYGCGEFTGG